MTDEQFLKLPAYTRSILGKLGLGSAAPINNAVPPFQARGGWVGGGFAKPTALSFRHTLLPPLGLRYKGEAVNSSWSKIKGASSLTAVERSRRPHFAVGSPGGIVGEQFLKSKALCRSDVPPSPLHSVPCLLAWLVS